MERVSIEEGQKRETNIDGATIKKLLPSTSNEMRQDNDFQRLIMRTIGGRPGGGWLQGRGGEVEDGKDQVALMDDSFPFFFFFFFFFFFLVLLHLMAIERNEEEEGVDEGGLGGRGEVAGGLSNTLEEIGSNTGKCSTPRGASNCADFTWKFFLQSR